MKDLRVSKTSGTQTQHLEENEGFNTFIQVFLESRQPDHQYPKNIENFS